MADTSKHTVDHDRAKEKILEAAHIVASLTNSREKSLALTKLDEARHWLEDDRLRVHWSNGGR